MEMFAEGFTEAGRTTLKTGSPVPWQGAQSGQERERNQGEHHLHGGGPSVTNYLTLWLLCLLCHHR